MNVDNLDNEYEDCTKNTNTTNNNNNINIIMEKDKHERKKQNFIIPMFNIKSYDDEAYSEKKERERERELQMEWQREREREEEIKKRLSLPPRDDDGSLQTVKQLFRIVAKGGRVKYVIIYVDGEVREANSSNIYDFAPPQVLHKYEHMCFLKDYNMETIYVKDSDMGAWARGTSTAIIREMERAVRQAHKLAKRLNDPNDQKDGSASATDSGVPRSPQRARQSQRVSKKRFASKVLIPSWAGEKLGRDAYGTSETDGDRERGDEYSDSSSNFPPLKKAKQIVRVSVPIGKRMTIVATPPMKQIPITSFFGKSGLSSGSPSNGSESVFHNTTQSNSETDDLEATQLKQEYTAISRPELPYQSLNVGQKLSPLPPFVISETGPGNDEISEYEVEAIVKHKVQNGVTYYLVKWVGFPSEENTWEPMENLTGSSDLVQIYHENIKSWE